MEECGASQILRWGNNSAQSSVRTLRVSDSAALNVRLVLLSLDEQILNASVRAG